jgi:hypothetical protein
MRLSQFLVMLVVVSLPVTFVARPSLAYIDPGTGSMVFQAILATLLGGVFLIKSFWFRINQFLFRKKTVTKEFGGSPSFQANLKGENDTRS